MAESIQRQMSAGSAGTRVNSVSPGEITEVQNGCGTALECVVEDTLATVLIALVFVVGFVLPIAVLAFVHLRDALSALRSEREEAIEEGNAYAAFVRRVARMDPETGATPAADGGAAPGGGAVGRGGLVHGGQGTLDSPNRGGLDPVIDAYRETVMAQAGRASADDGAVLADMAAEFGEDLAATVRGSDRLTPGLHSALVQSGRRAADRREDLVDAVDREIDAVGDARSTFEDLDRRVTDEARGPLEKRPHGDLLETWRALTELEERCESRLQRRQSEIHGESFNRAGSELTDDPALQSYLYDSLDVDFPVLAEGTDLLARVRQVRRRVESALAAR